MTGAVFLKETVPLSMSLAAAAEGLQRRIEALTAMELASSSAVGAGCTHAYGSVTQLPDLAVQHAPSYLRGGTTVYPLRWLVVRGAESPHVLLDANLELDAVSERLSDLSLLGSLRPSALGVDHAGLPWDWPGASRVVARSFLTGVAESLLR